MGYILDNVDLAPTSTAQSGIGTAALDTGSTNFSLGGQRAPITNISFGQPAIPQWLLVGAALLTAYWILKKYVL